MRQRKGWAMQSEIDKPSVNVSINFKVNQPVVGQHRHEKKKLTWLTVMCLLWCRDDFNQPISRSRTCGLKALLPESSNWKTWDCRIIYRFSFPQYRLNCFRTHYTIVNFLLSISACRACNIRNQLCTLFKTYNVDNLFINSLRLIILLILIRIFNPNII